MALYGDAAGPARAGSAVSGSGTVGAGVEPAWPGGVTAPAEVGGGEVWASTDIGAAVTNPTTKLMRRGSIGKISFLHQP
jgi:hypothetical protein